MPQQDIKGASGVNTCQRLQDALYEVDVAADWHFEGEAVSEGDIFSDGLENISVFGCHHCLRGEPQVPELDEQGLKRLDLEDLGERHSRERVIRVHPNYIVVALTAV